MKILETCPKCESVLWRKDYLGGFPICNYLECPLCGYKRKL